MLIQKRMPVKRMPRGLVALSASAVAAVYLAGYVQTRAADASIGAAALPVPTMPTPLAAATPVPPAPSATPGRTRGAPATQAPAAVPRATATPVPAVTTQPAYTDGTFVGQGSSRRGDVWVSVRIEAGRIAAVDITRSTLQYPLRDIAGLPAQVVQRQSAQVDIVSRATYSSQAFRTAVSQALAQAVRGA